MIDENYLHAFIDNALAEDVGPGDHSSNCSIPAEAVGRMQLLIKEKGILAGVGVAGAVFNRTDPTIEMEILINDGAPVKVGDIAFTIAGPVRSLLRAERLALNLMQRMSGIATYTNFLVDKISGTNAKLLDTRKTTPNLRPIEKEAVKIGGGHNHRFGLFDMIMLKDNHIDFAGGIENAIRKAQEYLKNMGLKIPIEVETRDLGEVKQVLKTGGVQRVMFDNFTPEKTVEAVKLVQGKLETESSGGITEKNIREYAETEVDFISVGALTHSVKGLDMSLKAI